MRYVHFGFLLLLACTFDKKATSPDYRIVYNVYENAETDDYELYSMSMEGKDIRNITKLPGVEWTYYAYKDRLLYISDKDTCRRCYLLWECDAFGENRVQVSDQRLRDSWMSARKNGEQYIVNPRIEGDSAFHIIDRRGGLIQKVYTGLVYQTDPHFSPDGNRIVFRGSNKRFKKNIGYQDELYVVNLDGSELRQLTYYPQNDTTAKWWEYHAGPPFWESNRNIITFNSVQQSGSFLFQINPDGTGLKKLTPDSLSVGWHSWAPDGEWIAFDGMPASNKDSKSEIYLMNYESGQIKRMTSDSISQQAPVFVEVKK